MYRLLQSLRTCVYNFAECRQSYSYSSSCMYRIVRLVNGDITTILLT